MGYSVSGTSYTSYWAAAALIAGITGTCALASLCAVVFLLGKCERRDLARIQEMPCGRVVEREIIEIPGYSMIYAATGEEIAANIGWSRALWN